MTNGEQIDAFTGEIERVILRFRKEFNLPLAAAVGALEIVKFDLMHDISHEDDEDEEPTSSF